MRRFMTGLIVVMALFGAVISPTFMLAPTSAAARENCRDSYLGVTTWYRGLTKDDCSIKSVGDGGSDVKVNEFIMKVALNVLAAAFSIAAYVALFFIIKSGFRYMTSAGSSDGMSAAKKGLTNAIIGLIITLLSAVIVNTIVGAL